MGRQRRLQRRGARRLAAARVRRLCQPGGRPTRGDPARRRGDLLPGRRARAVRVGWRHLDEHQRQLHAGLGQGPGHPHQGRRPPGSGGGHRAADGGSNAGRGRDRRLDRGGHHRHRPHRPVHPVRLPAGRVDGDDRTRLLRRHRVRTPGLARSDTDPSWPGRLRAGDRAGHRCERAGVRTRSGGVRRTGEVRPHPRHDDRLQQGVVRDPRLERHHSSLPPPCCSSWPPAR